MPDHEIVSEKLDAIETELKQIGFWRTEPLPPHMFQFTQAFAMDTMPFACWLQFIFIPRVRTLIEERGPFPATSMIAAQAIREFDGQNEAGRLITLLSDFDALFS